MAAESESSAKLPSAPGGAPEGSLIGESMWGAIQALKERGRSKKQVARELGLDVKTVRKWWRRTWRPQRRAKRGRRLDRFCELVRGRAPEVGFNAVVLHRELVALGFEGSYSAVVKYLQPLRAAWRPEEAPTERFETGPAQRQLVLCTDDNYSCALE